MKLGDNFNNEIRGMVHSTTRSSTCIEDKSITLHVEFINDNRKYLICAPLSSTN